MVLREIRRYHQNQPTEYEGQINQLYQLYKDGGRKKGKNKYMFNNDIGQEKDESQYPSVPWQKQWKNGHMSSSRTTSTTLALEG